MIDVSLVSSAHDVADGRLHRLCGAMTAAGLQVEVLCRGAIQDAPAGVEFRPLLPGRVGVRPRLGRVVLGLARARGRCALVLDPELALAGLVWRRARGRVLVADVHEDYVAVASDRAWATGRRGDAARLLARVATAGAARADLTAVADEHVPPSRARERMVVRNQVRAGEARAEHLLDPAPRAVYVGDVRASRGFRTMVEAVDRTPPWTLDVVGPVAEPDQAWFDAGRHERVRLHGRLSPARSWQVAAGAWAGLAVLDDTPAFRASVPTKVYEYLAHGLAVVVTPLPRVAALVRQADAGAVVSGVDELCTTLTAWLTEPHCVDAFRANARQWSDRQSTGTSAFDRLAERLVSLVER